MAKTPAAAPDEEPQAPSVAITEAEMAAVTLNTAQALAAQDKVMIRLYQVPDGSSDPKLPDEVVCVNGHIYQIQRGVEVEVPATVADILEQAGRR